MEPHIHLSGYKGSLPRWPAFNQLTASVAFGHAHTNNHVHDLTGVPAGRTEDQAGTAGVCLFG